MKKRYLLFILILLVNAAYTQDHSIIPCPVSYEVGNDGDFQLSNSTIITINRNDKELLRLARLIGESINLGSRQNNDIVVNEADKELIKKYNNVIELTLSAINNSNDEGYNLIVKSNRIILKASSYRGLFYGIQSFIQMIPPEFTLKNAAIHEDINRNNKELTTNNQLAELCINGCKIVDYPRFKYRGMHLDVCGHYFPLEFIKNILI